MSVETLTPDGVMAPIGPYSHIARSGPLIVIGAVAGVDPVTNELVGPEVGEQTMQIVKSFEHMLAGLGADLGDVMHVSVYLLDMADFAAMNTAYAEAMGAHRPARSAVAVRALPKPGARVTMALMAASPDGASRHAPKS